MLNRRTLLTSLGFLFAAAVTGCGPDATPAPTVAVEATFLSASLSDDCAAAGAPSEADCASFAPNCGICRQTNMQIRFVAGVGAGPVHVEVASVRLLDAATGAVLDTLTAREPTSWSESSSTYVAWDRDLATPSTVRASWKLSAPNWAAVSASSTSLRASYMRPLRLEVVLRIDGVARTLRSGELTREPEVVT